ncbi:glycoside hydrolase 28 protein [Plenodomus lingam]|uniref:glycoside hydrolase 28 protein n=1 Tax=Leptosphaeria maculans TaxID=5022 RepID=UPI0033179C19|nr:glycoside hydrolase 28 protein [Plenodomus lingam]
MVAIQIASFLFSAGALVSAMPTSLDARGNCTFSDAAALAKGKGSCSSIVIKDMNVPAGTTLDLTKLKSGTTVTFEGATTFGYKEWEGPLISVSGDNIKVNGASGHCINGDGQKWWDGKGSNGGKKKPKFFAAHSMTSSTITGLNIRNTPVQGFSINQCKGLTVDQITIDNSAGNGPNGGHNTDAFDVGSSSDIHITNANVKNQDDCLAVNSGTDIFFSKCTCDGGHGISIGSVGGRSDNVVKNVFITDSTIINSENGVRIKTVAGATGSVSNVTYKNITLKNITKNGIVIRQDYQNGSPTNKPTAGISVTGIHLEDIHGTVASGATNILILCGKGSCSNWTWSNVNVTGGKKSSMCQNVPAGASC